MALEMLGGARDRELEAQWFKRKARGPRAPGGKTEPLGSGEAMRSRDRWE